MKLFWSAIISQFSRGQYLYLTLTFSSILFIFVFFNENVVIHYIFKVYCVPWAPSLNILLVLKRHILASTRHILLVIVAARSPS